MSAALRIWETCLANGSRKGPKLHLKASFESEKCATNLSNPPKDSELWVSTSFSMDSLQLLQRSFYLQRYPRSRSTKGGSGRGRSTQSLVFETMD